jgi:hypothetical protein
LKEQNNGKKKASKSTQLIQRGFSEGGDERMIESVSQTSSHRYVVLEPKHRFGARISISLTLPQLWQVGDTYRVNCLQLKKATAYSRDAKVDASDKDKG